MKLPYRIVVHDSEALCSNSGNREGKKVNFLPVQEAQYRVVQDQQSK